MNAVELEPQCKARAGGDDKVEEFISTPPLHMHIAGITGSASFILER
jgi:hypothetical protein